MRSLNAVVRKEYGDNGETYMVIGGDIDMDRLESVFDECMVNVEDFIIDDIPDIENYGIDFEDIDDDLLECGGDNDVTDNAGDDAPLDENVVNDYPKFDEVEINEKKKGCCPKKKVNESKSTPLSSLGKEHYSKNKKVNESGTLISSLGKKYYHKEETNKNQHLIPLKEALSGKPLNYQKNPDVNEIIDSLTGKKNSRRINEAAIEKARKEASKSINENYEYLSKKLGEDLAGRIWKALGEKKTSLHEKVKINGKAVSEFTLEELKGIFEKVNKKIDELENTTKTEGLNETDATNAEKTLALNTRLKTILTEEIEFRSALKEADDVDSFLDQFNLDPNAEDNTDDNSNDNNSDDNKSDENNADDNNNDNPDNDEVEEIGSIVLTMASEQAANDLKDELVAEGVPEDVIEIEPVEDEDEDNNDEDNNSSDENNNSEDNNAEENKENSDEEKPNESAGSKVKGVKLNEDDENKDDANADNNGDDDNQDNSSDDVDANADDSDNDEDEKQYKVILTDTDYADKLQTVM